MEPPSTLQCELRPYQKQALHWMTQLERGRNTDEAATTLHPCWNAYRLKDEYVNVGLHAFTIYFHILYTKYSFQEGACCLLECIFG